MGSNCLPAGKQLAGAMPDDATLQIMGNKRSHFSLSLWTRQFSSSSNLRFLNFCICVASDITTWEVMVLFSVILNSYLAGEPGCAHWIQVGQVTSITLPSEPEHIEQYLSVLACQLCAGCGGNVPDQAASDLVWLPLKNIFSLL